MPVPRGRSCATAGVSWNKDAHLRHDICWFNSISSQLMPVILLTNTSHLGRLRITPNVMARNIHTVHHYSVFVSPGLCTCVQQKVTILMDTGADDTAYENRGFCLASEACCSIVSEKRRDHFPDNVVKWRPKAQPHSLQQHDSFPSLLFLLS